MKWLRRSLRALGLLMFASCGASICEAQPPPIRVMPLGDSLTDGEALTSVQGGYRNRLYTLLTLAAYKVDFIGTFSDTANPTLPDVNHQGLGGARIDNLQPNIGNWLNAIEDPDVVLLLIGTNDVWQNYQLSTAASRLTNLVADIATKRPYAKIIISNLPPRIDNSSFEAKQVTYNSAIPGIVSQQVALGRQVSWLDMHSVLTPFDYSSDGVHPSAAGYVKMANSWSSKIASVISPLGSSSPPAVVRAESAVDLQHVTVKFSKPIADSATALANFSLNGGLAISAAVLDSATKRSITLSTSVQTSGTLYTLAVSGVRDRTSQQNLIAAGTTVAFSSYDAANGSFEQDFTGWTSTGNMEIVSAAPYAASNGSKLVAFNGGNSTPNGVLSKTFITVAGQAYTLAFDAGVLAYNTSSQALRVTATGSSSLLSQTVTLNGLGGGATRWAAQSFTFVANSAATTLTFRDQSSSTSNLDLLLDNVRFSRIASNPNTAPVAVADTYPAYQDTALVVPAAGVLGNDTDGQSNPLTAAINAGPSHGSAILNANGGFSYTPDAGYTGPDSFTYHANDGSLDSNIVSVAITVNALAAGGLVNGSFESGLTGWTATGNLAAQSPGPWSTTDGIKLTTFNSSDATPNGILSQTFATTVGQSYILAFDAGVLSYTTDSQTLQVSVTGSGSLLSQTITITGLSGGTNRWLPYSFTFVANSPSTTLTFRDQSVATIGLDLMLDNVRISGGVRPPNTAAVAVADSYSTAKDTVLVVPATGVLGNDTDAQSNPLTAVLDVPPGNGNVILNLNGGFSYTPATGYTGADSFTYHASDGSLNSNIVSVSISVNAVVSTALVNGSFESGFTGWTTSGNQAIKSASPYVATDGTKLVAFNGGNTTPNAVLSQSFATTVGQTYKLAFDAGVLSYNTNPQKMLVTVTGIGSLLSQTITINGLSGGTNRWLAQSFSFVADSAATTLTFSDQSTTTNVLDLLLDKVRVAGQPVIPASLAPQRAGSAVTSSLPPSQAIAPQQPASLGTPTLVGVPGSFVISMTTTEAGSYFLERSENLVTWEYLEARECPAQVLLEFHDAKNPLGTEAPKNRIFYRIGRQPDTQNN